MRPFLLFICMALSLPAAAYFQVDLLKGKTVNKNAKNVQWTLADWLAQKKKNSLMDEWLTLHRSSDLIDLSLVAAVEQYTLKSENAAGGILSTSQNAQNYRADIYISLLNLQGEYQKTNACSEAYSGAVGLRLLGSSVQTTSLIARYGWRHLTDFANQEHWDNVFVEGELQLYIVSAFGLSGSYRSYFPANSNLAQGLQGSKLSVGGFFEWSGLRIFANYFSETLKVTQNPTLTRKNSAGFEGGARFFF